jgi:hypothetical protein
MDPISHVLLARTMGRVTSVPRDVPGRTAALALGSLAPDVDILLAPFGWDFYLTVHEVGAHTLVASPILAVAVAAIVQRFAKGARAPELWKPAWAGVLVGHLLLDLVSGSDMRLFSPLWSWRWATHWLTMADGLVFVLLTAGTIAGFWRRELAAMATIVALLAVVGVKAWSQRWAVQAFEKTNHAVSHPEALNGSLWRWTFFDRQDAELRVWRVDAWSGDATLLFTRTDAGGDELVRPTTSAPVVRRLLALAHQPFARTENAENGHRLVLWSDVHHCGPKTCNLSFGVEVDDVGRWQRQVVRIGPVHQWRGLQ